MAATLPLHARAHASPASARPRSLAHAARIVAALLVADLRQRTRSTRFRVVALAVALSAWWCLPPVDAGYMMLAIGDHHRGFYSSAWIGMVLAMLSMMWALVGFYLVRGTVQRDFDTRVWQLLGTTAMRRGAYLAAKWASHVVVMGGLVAATLLVGLAAQWARAEDRHVDVWELVKPSLFIALPTLSVSAALAIWFDVVPALRRTAGSVLFFFVWTGLLTAGGLGVHHDVQQRNAGHAPVAQPWASDLGAMNVLQWSVDHQVARVAPDALSREGFCLGCGGVDAPPRRFTWTTWEVAPGVLWGRMLWLAGALAGVLLAVPLLDWAASRTSASTARGARPPRELRWLRALLAPLQRTPRGALAAAEALVVLRLRPLWWWAAWLPLWGLQAFGAPHASALAMLGGWTLLLDVFARTGLRDVECRTLAFVASAPGALPRLFAARAAMLVGLACIAVAPGLLHALAAHPATAATAAAMGASLALWGLAGAALCRSSRPFELVYLVVAYATTQGLPWLDASARGAGAGLAHLAAAGVAAAVLTVHARRG